MVDQDPPSLPSLRIVSCPGEMVEIPSTCFFHARNSAPLEKSWRLPAGAAPPRAGRTDLLWWRHRAALLGPPPPPFIWPEERLHKQMRESMICE